MADLNPFFHRGPIHDPAYFFGRGKEIRFITDLLRAGQSVSLSGPRRFGKTSLLFHLAHPDIATAHGLGPDSTRWIYLDGGMLDGLEAEWFYGAVDRALGGEADAVPYPRFVETVRTLAAQHVRLILALDEFELIAANPRLGLVLFNHLRGLAAWSYSHRRRNRSRALAQRDRSRPGARPRHSQETARRSGRGWRSHCESARTRMVVGVRD